MSNTLRKIMMYLPYAMISIFLLIFGFAIYDNLTDPPPAPVNPATLSACEKSEYYSNQAQSLQFAGPVQAAATQAIYWQKECEAGK